MSALGRRPFVLLEDLEKGTAALYESPYATVTAATISEVADALRHADALVEDGAHLAGWIGYEAGYALEPRLHPLLDRQWRKSPLLRLFAFPQPRIFPADAVDHWLSGMARRDAHLDPLEPVIGFQDYAAAFRRVKDAIEAGDIYQANLTFPLQGRWRGDPLALYRAIRPEANARFAALIFDGRDWLLSFSPELFFSLSDDTLKVRPMKGTRPRGADAESDRRLARELAESVKDRAENLMIVDLMRNDLSRISQPGSVKVDRLFRVETYPTVFQMTTGISSRVDGPPAMSRILQAMFPCGSITGAPKMRAMEIIHEVEHWSRGPYCGAIGAFARTERGEGSDQVRGWRGRFNVAIRTLRLRPGVNGRLGTALFGVGSGIVADSVLEEEWEECLLKARFVERGLARRISEQVQGRKVG
ncbi:MULTISPECIES: aminodeoxychorismate synthase component I [Sphingobium]|uniref:aminodeoxychorismate synthase component I n=1 Tax=Sphingobium TaxID=165695 RepID=UPI00159C1B59|nr:aminodeoxychorismate synthase component I [Sphingobium sp. 15-1]